MIGHMKRPKRNPPPFEKITRELEKDSKICREPRKKSQHYINRSSEIKSRERYIYNKRKKNENEKGKITMPHSPSNKVDHVGTVKKHIQTVMEESKTEDKK